MQSADNTARHSHLESATSWPRAAAARAAILAVVALIAVIALGALGALGAPATSFAATPFVHETVDVGGTAGQFSSLELDSRGNPHVGYSNSSDGRLWYAFRAGSTWVVESGPVGAGGAFSSLALDAQGSAHVSSYDVATDDLEYHTRIGSSWTSEIVDAPGDVGLYTAIALTEQGSPRISYVDFTNTNLKYAAKNGGVWTIELVDAAGISLGTSLAIDAQGNPHVSYYDNPTGNLKYAVRYGSAWFISEVDTSGIVGLHSSLALDAQGNPRISYYHNGNADLMFASKTASSWTIQVVDSAGSVGRYTSLALDAQGNPRVSYFDEGNGDLRFATRGASSWLIETIDATGVVGAHTSLALDAQGNPIVSYVDEDNDDLKLTSAAVRLVGPSVGATWAVGSLQEIRWAGAGTVDVSLSVDGGRSFDLIRNDYIENAFAVRVPHAPTRFAQIRVQRGNPLSTAFSDSFFTIDAAIALAKFDARVIDADAPVDAGARAGGAAGGAVRAFANGGARAIALAWATTPGPEADIRYRVERAAGDGAAFAPIHDGSLATRELVDREAGAAADARYRLIAINGLGEEYVLGEARVAAALGATLALRAYPNPAAGGAMSILFRVPFERRVALDVYDASGRHVRALASGEFAEGVRSAAWDGRDDAGRDVAAGAYWLRLASPSGFAATERVTVIR